MYLRTKHELTVSYPFNIQLEFTAGDSLTMASRPTCLNEKTMNTQNTQLLYLAIYELAHQDLYAKIQLFP